jgi:ribonuclease HI
MVVKHAEEIKDISLQNYIIGYSDGSKLDNQDTGAGVYLINGTTFPEIETEHSWYLGKNAEVYDAELFAILKTLQLGLKMVENNDIDKPIHVYIFSDSSAAIERLQKHHDLGPGHSIARESIRIAQILKQKGANTTLKWIPGHSDIQGNERADTLAKRGAKNQQSDSHTKVSLTNIRRKLNQSIIEGWKRDWLQQKNKGRHYQQFEPKISRKAIKSITDRRTWTAYIQLKLGHGYFRSYLHRLPQYDTNRCIGTCQGIQSPVHLFLSCHHYKREQRELKDKLKDLSPGREPTLVEVYAEKSRQAVYEYLKKTRIATREWLLGMEEGEGEENTPDELN